MKSFAIFFIAFLFVGGSVRAQDPEAPPLADPYTIDLARAFAKDVFELNGAPYLQPMVKAVNASSNARFFHSAHVPKEVDKPYFRVSLHSMVGFVPNNLKTYEPYLPREQYASSKLPEFIGVNYDGGKVDVSIKDTALLIHYFFKTLLYEGYDDGSISVPESAPTILGKGNVPFHLPHSTMENLVENHPLWDDPLWNLLPGDQKQAFQDSLLNAVKPYINQFPELFYLPEGANYNSFVVGVPQFEIGSWHGTELLVRFIPPINLGKDVGDFAFWGAGLKHSVSQYFAEPWLDVAIQAAYQGTHLENHIGITNAFLEADATMFNFNAQASKSVEGVIDVYAGASYETIDISSEYEYYLPIDIQWQLGMIEPYQFEPTSYPPGSEKYPEGRDFPGDTKPQIADIEIDDQNVKFTVGLHKKIGDFGIFADFSFSKINVFSGGVYYQF